MKVYSTVRTSSAVFALSLTLVACGTSQPLDPYAAQRQQLQWEQQQRAAQTAQNRAAFLEPAMRVLDLTFLLAPVALLFIGLDAYRLRRRLVVADAAGKLPLPRRTIETDPRPAIAALGAFHSTALAAASPRTLAAPPSAPALIPTEAETPALPGLTNLSSLVIDWRPSLHSILLGVGPGNVRYTVHARDLCHVALAGATGGGKSNIMRLVLAQLQAAGAKVVLADPHFAPLDIEAGDDWRPIASRLHMPAAISASDIGSMLEWLATDELPQRLERRRAGTSPGQPLFLALDELPAIVADVKAAPEHLARILREGRKANLFVVGAAQDWLAKTLGGSGAIRDCYRTAYYVGGDTTSARVLLDITGRVDDGSLGQGLAMLRSKATPTAQLIRVPLASNNALYELLGQPRTIDVTPVQAQEGCCTGTCATQPLQPDQEACKALARDMQPLQGLHDRPELADICRRLVAQGMGQNAILAALWNVKPGGNEPFRLARDQYRRIIEGGDQDTILSLDTQH